MEKIYGYREEDIINLAQFLKGRENQPLSKTFEEYALLTGRAKGTIRNVYYALAKLSAKDQDFRRDYLDGKVIKISKINGFTEDEERRLARDVLRAKLQGKSVRKAILEMANGDAKLALRYQNKFRNMIKKDEKTFKEIAREMNYQTTDTVFCGINIKDENKILLDKLIEKLKVQIDGLIERINQKITRENDILKLKNSYLQAQIISLKNYQEKTRKNLLNTSDINDINNTDFIN